MACFFYVYRSSGFFQVDITGIVRRTSYARYCKEGGFEASQLALAHVLLGAAEGKDLV